jgi:hydroxylaminobenzene mutase
MSPERVRQKLVWHGVALFLLGLLTGLLIPALTSQRLGLAAHMEGLLNAMFLLLVGGVVWKDLRLSEGGARLIFWLLLFGAYGGWAFCLLAAAFGASRMLPIAGAGYSAAPWQEMLVSVGLVGVAASMLIVVGFMLYGLRWRSGEEASPESAA